MILSLLKNSTHPHVMKVIIVIVTLVPVMVLVHKVVLTQVKMHKQIVQVAVSNHLLSVQMLVELQRV